jgi:hypothetical protein
MDWFEVYYWYLEGCRRFNECVDPDQGWEWNHTLPQCIFGDQPPGQWLTKQQHATATAYQTLAWDRNCLYGGHLKYLSQRLKDLVTPLYQKGAKSASDKGVVASAGMGILDPKNKDKCLRGGDKGRQTMVALGIGVCGPNNTPEMIEGMYKGGQTVADRYGRPVVLTCKATGVEVVIPTVRGAARHLGVKQCDIYKVLSGGRKTVMGHMVRYEQG